MAAGRHPSVVPSAVSLPARTPHQLTRYRLSGLVLPTASTRATSRPGGHARTGLCDARRATHERQGLRRLRRAPPVLGARRQDHLRPWLSDPFVPGPKGDTQRLCNTFGGHCAPIGWSGE